MSLSTSLRFVSERFDYRSELPAEYNAGNRFYGKDVAEFLVAQLEPRGFAADFLDEDWGWLVTGAQGPTVFEVAIYNLAEHGEGGRPGVGEWGLWMRSHERTKVLGFLSKRTDVAVPPALVAAIEDAVRAAGAEPMPWQDGPGS